MDYNKLISKGFNLLITLDSLVDTRLPIIKSISEEIYNEILDTKYYDQRVIDQFKTIPRSVFRHYYNKRNLSTIAMSLLSNIYEPLTIILKSLLSETIRNNGNSIKIFLNIYPYNSIPDKLVESIRLAFIEYTKVVDFELEVINKSYTDMDINWLSDNVKVIVDYDGHLLLESISTYDKKDVITLSDITIYIPALLNKDIPNDDNDVLKIFKDTEKLIAPMIKLVYLPVSDFNTPLISIKSYLENKPV